MFYFADRSDEVWSPIGVQHAFANLVFNLNQGDDIVEAQTLPIVPLCLLAVGIWSIPLEVWGGSASFGEF